MNAPHDFVTIRKAMKCLIDRDNHRYVHALWHGNRPRKDDGMGVGTKDGSRNWTREQYALFRLTSGLVGHDRVLNYREARPKLPFKKPVGTKYAILRALFLTGAVAGVSIGVCVLLLLPFSVHTVLSATMAFGVACASLKHAMYYDAKAK